jgi:transcriptional regulator with XRE-family HTH domain
LLGLTQGQIGGAIGVRVQQIQRYECGANKMSAVTLWKLAQALDVSLDYFFDDLK